MPEEPHHKSNLGESKLYNFDVYCSGLLVIGSLASIPIEDSA